MTGFGFGPSGDWPERVEHDQLHLPDLNTAPERRIAALTGVGHERARRLVEYREKYGALNLIEDLRNIPGFDDSLIESLRDQVLVGGRKT